MTRVLVLLATYNGEAYLKEQIDSVLAQTGVEVTILAADDRSEDGTRSVLEGYARDPRFSYRVNAARKNFAYNFLDLVFSAGEDFDYYALCDQDDVWLPDKLERAVRLLGGLEKKRGRGGLYCSNLTVTDERLRPLCMMEDESVFQTDKRTFVFENIATGCTIVFDRPFLGQIKKYYPAGIGLHDHWLLLVAAYTADCLYDFESRILYRQHGGNVIGCNRKKWTWRNLRRFLRERGSRSVLAGELLAGYREELAEEDIARLETLRDYKRRLSCRMELLRWRGRTRQKTLFLRARAILGKL